MDRGAWRATVHGVEKSKTQLSTAQPSSKPNVSMGSYQSRHSTLSDRRQFPQPLEMLLLLPELPFLCLCLSGSYASFKTHFKHPLLQKALDQFPRFSDLSLLEPLTDPDAGRLGLPFSRVSFPRLAGILFPGGDLSISLVTLLEPREAERGGLQGEQRLQ